MSKPDKADPKGAANILGGGAAVLCAFLGYDHGGWPIAALAAVVAFGGVHLAFTAIAIGWRFLVTGVVLLLILAALKNRWDWLMSLAQ